VIELQEVRYAGRTVQVYEDARLILGFTEGDFTAAALQRFLAPRPLLFLKQIHGKTILNESSWRPASAADGLLLRKPDAVAVIQTADCVPLFYFSDDRAVGGIIHVGWQGLAQGIETELLSMLPGERSRYHFFMGPAIEKKCYPVGEELLNIFGGKPYGTSFFTRRADGKWLMDIKAGLSLSLRQAGIAAGRIQDCGLCTFCHPGRFPSYRRDGKTGRRIFSFFTCK
jgi:YfiH family protein